MEKQLFPIKNILTGERYNHCPFCLGSNVAEYTCLVTGVKNIDVCPEINVTPHSLIES